MARFGKGAVQAAVHSAKPLHCKGLCNRDEISSGGKHWFQRLGATSSSNLEHVLPRLENIRSNVWELLVASS